MWRINLKGFRSYFKGVLSNIDTKFREAVFGFKKCQN